MCVCVFLAQENVNTCINGKYLKQNRVPHCQRYGTINRSINNKAITSITANVTNSLSSLAMCGTLGGELKRSNRLSEFTC